MTATATVKKSEVVGRAIVDATPYLQRGQISRSQSLEWQRVSIRSTGFEMETEGGKKTGQGGRVASEHEALEMNRLPAVARNSSRMAGK
jgi:hypothetical protein